MAKGSTVFASFRRSIFWLFFATEYIKPAKKPTETADTEPGVTGSPKKIIPEAATGNLFKAPTMLRFDINQGVDWTSASITDLYVVLLVTLMHHAVV